MVVKLRNKFYLNANYSSIFKFLSMNFNQYFSLTPKKGKKYTCKALILINIFGFQELVAGVSALGAVFALEEAERVYFFF